MKYWPGWGTGWGSFRKALEHQLRITNELRIMETVSSRPEKPEPQDSAEPTRTGVQHAPERRPGVDAGDGRPGMGEDKPERSGGFISLHNWWV